MNSLVVKRSIVIAGRKTSISIEDAFWNSLREIAHRRKETLSQLIGSIDANRKAANLSSVIRVFVLEFYRNQFEREMMVSQAIDDFARPLALRSVRRIERRRPTTSNSGVT